MSSSLLAQRPPAIDFIPPSTVDCDSAFALTTPSRTRESRLPFVSGGITSTTPSPIKLHKSTRNKDGNIRVKSVCRYGPGCTHIADNNHREKFWHPSVQELTEEDIKNNFICNECGYATKKLADLQLHLQRKTAWSNTSLVGCRINCLIDHKEWHEGLILQFHPKNGKHYVEFGNIGEKRWCNMKKYAFYITERPLTSNHNQHNNTGGNANREDQQADHEYKDDQDDIIPNLAPIEDEWTFCEEISMNYAFAQSVLFKVYGNNLQETGHLTKGHICLTEMDRISANDGKCSLLYGELLPRGANKAMGLERLNVYDGKTLYDLGMGTGKIVLQAFLQFRNLQYIHGVELSAGRFRIAEDATLRMIDMLGVNNFQIIHEPGQYLIVRERKENSPTSPRNMTKNPSSHLPTLSQTDLLLPTEEVDTMAKEHSMNELADYASASVTSDIFMKEVLNEEYGRVLHLACGNLFDTLPTIQHADVIMMETDVPTDLYPNLFNLFLQTKLHCRILSYLDFRRVFDGSIGTMTSVQTIPTTGSNATHALLSPQLSPAIHMIHQVVLSIHGPEMFLQQLDVNKTLADRYPTSWSVQRGHHFYLWVKMGAEEHGRINPWSKKYGSAHGNQGDGHHHAYYDHAHHLEQASQEGFLTSCFPLFPSIFGRKKKNKKGGKSKTDFASPSSSSSSSPSTAGAASPSNTMPDPSSPFRTVASNANSPQATDDHNNITTIPSSWKNKLNPGSPFDRTSMTVSPNKSTEDNSSLPVMSGMDLIDIYQDRSNLIKAQSISNIIEDEQSAVDNVMRTSPINLPREEGEKNYTSNVKSGKRQKGNKSKKNQVNDSSNKVTSTSPASVITSHTDDDLHNSPSRFRDDAIPFPADIRTTLRTSLPKLDGESYPGDLPMSSSLLQCNSNSPGREKSSIVLSNEMDTEMMLMSAAEGRHQDEEEEDELRRSPQDLDGYNNHTNNSSRKSPRDKSSSKKKSNKSNKVKGSNAYFEGGTSNGLPAVQETPRSNLDHIPHCEASIYALRQQQDDQSNTTPTPSSNPFSSQWNSGTNHDGRPMGNAPRPSSASSTSSTESQSKCTIM